MPYLKNVAGQHLYAVLVNALDGTAITAGATIALAGDGGAEAAGTGTLTHKGGGLWDYALSQAETNFNAFGYAFGGTNVIPQGGPIVTVDYPRNAIPPVAATSPNGLLTSGAGSSQITTDSNGRVKVQVGAGVGQLDTVSGAVKLVPATAADLANNNTLNRAIMLMMPNDGPSTQDTLPDQTGMTTTQVKLAASATATNTPNGTVFTPTSGAQTKGRHIVHFDPATQIATLNNAWVTNPVGGDTYRTDPPPKTNTSGYNRQQTPDYYLLQNPGFPIANTTDGTGHVSIDPAAIIAGVWPNGALTVVDGVGASNYVQFLGNPAQVDSVANDVLDAAASSHNTAGTIGALINAAGSGGGSGGILGTAPLVFTDQRTNTTPTINDSLAMQWLAVCGTLQTNTSDPTKSDLLDPSGNIVFTFDAPVPVQIAGNGFDAVIDAAGFSAAAYLRFAAAGAAGNTEGSGPVGTAGQAFLRAVTRDGSPGAVIASMNYDENSDRTVTSVNPG